ncbi:hypothetical protein COLO4_13448 [Corchorus olitorius]|uniref:F-box domain-containing protein n=1 Tax=Corchorus olitorius TaxID=93759 RepID=A0A1R3JWI2_9ROSI|nr:hypothetical protein COLO4_13448 [Corchorus olitorius]
MVNWSNLPLGIVESIIGHLGWVDRIRMRCVCKAWSVSAPHIPTIDKFPWALKRLPFTGLKATLSLDATSPKCVIFVLRIESEKKKICIYICSPGDIAWKTYDFVFDPRLLELDSKVQHVGIFYCVFSKGELGAFNLHLEEWTMLTLEGPQGFDFIDVKLITSDGELRLMPFNFDFTQETRKHLPVSTKVLDHEQLDQKQALEFEIEQLRGSFKHQDEGLKATLEELRAGDRQEIEDFQAFNRTLIVRERESNDEFEK